MQKFSFSVNHGYNTLDNIATLNSLITTNIETPLVSTNPYGDAIEITFSGTLSSQEGVKLHNIITEWDSNTLVKYNKVDSITLSSLSGASGSHKRVGIYGYDGAATVGELKKITLVGYKDFGITSYCVRIFDINNSKIIAEAMFNNNSDDVMDMGPLSNIPDEPTVLEIQVKKTGGTNAQKVYISTMTFFS